MPALTTTFEWVGSVLSGRGSTTQAFYLSGSGVETAHLIQITDATNSAGTAINNAADPICTKHVGTYSTADGNWHRFVNLQAVGVATFDVPDAVLTQAWGINDNGDIVGAFQDKAWKTHGFLAPAPF